MKPFIFISLITLILGLSSCESSPFTARATGAPYDIAVVMDKELWESEIGDLIKEELATSVPYLFNSEASMKYFYVSPDFFEKHQTAVRNVLVVNVNNKMYTKATLRKSLNTWASGQVVLQLNTPDIETLYNYLFKNKGAFLQQYTQEEMRRAKETLKRFHSQVVLEQAKEKFDITIYVPEDIKKRFYPPVSYENPEECLWFTNDAINGRMDILIYSFPFVDNNTFTLDYLVAKRDSIAKMVVPGAFEGSYMSTEKRVVDYIPTMLNGKYCGVLKGLWRMEGGDMMGGPFVSYARVDEKNKRVIVTEGFVFEPRKDKRQYYRRLEAAMQTVLMPGEEEIQESQVAADDDEKKQE